MPGKPVAVEDLLRQLLNLVETVGISAFSAKEKGGEATAVLFEVELDGALYTLTRQAVAEPVVEAACIALSPREQEVVRLVAKGCSNKTIAAVLDISPWTVSTHLRRIFHKLDVGSRAEMITRALQESLVVW